MHTESEETVQTGGAPGLAHELGAGFGEESRGIPGSREPWAKGREAGVSMGVTAEGRAPEE